MENLRHILTRLRQILTGTHSLHCNVCILPTIAQCYGTTKLAELKMLEIHHWDNKGLDQTVRQTTVNFVRDWLLTSSDENGPKWCKAIIRDDDNAFHSQISFGIRQVILYS